MAVFTSNNLTPVPTPTVHKTTMTLLVSYNASQISTLQWSTLYSALKIGTYDLYLVTYSYIGGNTEYQGQGVVHPDQFRSMNYNSIDYIFLGMISTTNSIASMTPTGIYKQSGGTMAACPPFKVYGILF